MRWALVARGDFRLLAQQDRLEGNKQLQELFEGRARREIAALSRVADAVGRLPEVSEQEVVNVMTAVVGACDRETTRALAHDIALEGTDPEQLWRLLRELAELDARSSLAFIGARIEAIVQLREIEVGDEVAQSPSYSRTRLRCSTRRGNDRPSSSSKSLRQGCGCSSPTMGPAPTPLQFSCPQAKLTSLGSGQSWNRLATRIRTPRCFS